MRLTEGGQRIGRPPGPTQETIVILGKAAAMLAAGRTVAATCKELKIGRSDFSELRRKYSGFWKPVMTKASENMVTAIRAMVGTAAVLEDVDAYLLRVKHAEEFSKARRRPLFPHDRRETLCTFFETFYLPNQLQAVDAKPCTIELYRTVLRRWAAVTGDPPLEKITVETLTLFRLFLEKCRGNKGRPRASMHTIRKGLRHVLTVLNKAGPAGPRARDAAGILPSTPWIRSPKAEDSVPRTVSPEILSAVYDAAACMDSPWVEGIKPPAWWKALIVLAFNTSLRRRTLFEMRLDEISWNERKILLGGDRFKNRRKMTVHLNAVALEHLQTIRAPQRELVFPFPFGQRHFDTLFHRLQTIAGIPKKEWFGLHVIRKTAASILWDFAPETAQLALGHSTAEVTRRYYVAAMEKVARAFDAMPQPAAFMPRAIAGPVISPEIADRRAELVKTLAAAGITPDQAKTILNSQT